MVQSDVRAVRRVHSHVLLSQQGTLQLIHPNRSQAQRLSLTRLLSLAHSHVAVSLCVSVCVQHIMIDLGTGNNNKINWPLNNKQEMIDIIETVYRGAKKGRGLVVSPKDYSTKYKY